MVPQDQKRLQVPAWFQHGWSWRHLAERNKSNRERLILYDLTCEILKINQNRTRKPHQTHGKYMCGYQIWKVRGGEIGIW